jgi:hypothetical protein
MAAVFSGLTVLLIVVAFAARQPIALAVAIPFAIVAYVTYLQATGRLLKWARSGRQTERSQRSTRGARVDSRRVRADGDRGVTENGTGPWAGESRWGTAVNGSSGGRGTGLGDREARRILGVDQGANEGEIREAYRRKVKEVHPDLDGGDEAEFKRVTEAYETLREYE